MNYRIYKPIAIAVILNLVLPFIASPFASQDEIKPPNGASNLSYKGQIIHMLVHHRQVQLTSSIIIALIVFISITL
jgi:hypothetical protein